MAGPIDRSKLRKVTITEINQHVEEVLKMAEAGEFKNNEIDARIIGDKFQITMPKVERIFILAMKKGLRGYDLIYPTTGSPKPKNPFMNERTGIVISPKNIESLNERLASDKKFKVDDEFEVSLLGEDIVLKRI